MASILDGARRCLGCECALDFSYQLLVVWLFTREAHPRNTRRRAVASSSATTWPHGLGVSACDAAHDDEPVIHKLDDKRPLSTALSIHVFFFFILPTIFGPSPHSACW
jgi:hypothetical protein